MAVRCSLTCAAVKVSLFQDNDVSYSIPHRVKCRTEAVNNPSQSLETCQNARNHFIEAKIYKNIKISDTTPNSSSTSAWLCVTSNQWRNWRGRGVRAAPPGKLSGPSQRFHELQNMKVLLQCLEIRLSWNFKYWNSAVLNKPTIIKWTVNLELLQCSGVHCTLYSRLSSTWILSVMS